MNKLQQLKTMTTVVADTGDIHKIAQYKPHDATTNPSLILQAAQLEPYQHLVAEAIAFGQKQNVQGDELLHLIATQLHVRFGCEILALIPGYISTETNPIWSFDTEKTMQHARFIIDLYQSLGIDRQRVLIKIASTWEGIQAAKQLQAEGIQCNMTLLFSLHQAVACAQIGATLISPFVGRILDWYKANTGQEYTAEQDPGVLSVSKIYNYYKQHNHATIVMGASFRNQGEIEQLAGCDRLTISPALLESLQNDDGTLIQQLSPSNTGPKQDFIPIDEASFRFELNQNAMATDKLADGIRKFTSDTYALYQFIQSKI